MDNLTYLSTGYTKFDGGVRKYRGSDTWKYRLTVNGQTFEGDTGETNKRKAQAWVKRERAEHKRVKSVDALDAKRRETLAGIDKTPLGEAFALFLDTFKGEGKPAGKTREQTQGKWDHFVSYAISKGLRNITQITPQIARDYINQLYDHGRGGRRMGATTVLLYHDTCKRIMARLLADGNMRNPFDFPRQEGTHGTRDIFTPKFIKAMMEQADTFTKRIAQFGLLAGRRRMEICKMEWASLQTIQGRVYLMPKTDKHEDGTRRKNQGTVPVEGQLAALFDELRAERDEALSNKDLSDDERAHIERYVLPEHAKMKGSAISMRFRKMLDNLEGVELPTRTTVGGRVYSTLCIHSLRHTFIFNMARHEKDLQKSMKIAGHIDAGAHAGYRDHWTLDDLSDVMETMNTSIPQVVGVKDPKVPAMEPAPLPTDKEALIAALREALGGMEKSEKQALLLQLIMD
jgi:integrase